MVPYDVDSHPHRGDVAPQRNCTGQRCLVWRSQGFGKDLLNLGSSTPSHTPPVFNILLVSAVGEGGMTVIVRPSPPMLNRSDLSSCHAVGSLAAEKEGQA